MRRPSKAWTQQNSHRKEQPLEVWTMSEKYRCWARGVLTGTGEQVKSVGFEA
jgi:hypothetical protein